MSARAPQELATALPFIQDGRHGVREFIADLYAGLSHLIDEARASGELLAADFGCSR
jgi:hypothetical protein